MTPDKTILMKSWPLIIDFSSIACAVGAGLTAGVFFAFSSFVMSALAALPEEQGSAAMRSINVTVINPLFMGVFLGTGLLCIGLLGRLIFTGQWATRPWILAGSAIYLIGSIGVTLLGNVPLNDRLADPSLTGAALHGFWREYIAEWSKWNHVRTVASAFASLCFTAATYYR